MIGRGRCGPSISPRRGRSSARQKNCRALARRFFARVRKEHFFCGLSRERFAEELLDFYERTNELHPFREGNGRTQRVFLAQLAQNAGYRLDFSCVDADELMIATIYAAQGIDLPLKDVLDKIIKE